MLNKNIKKIFRDIELEIIRVLTEFDAPEEPVYSCAFYHFYWDGEEVHDPFFAYNTESTPSSASPKLRWHPPDWPMEDDGGFHAPLGPLYTLLGQALKNEPDSMWDKMSDYQDEMYCGMCLRLNESLNEPDNPFSKWNLTDDFVIGIFDWGRGNIMNDLAAKSVGKEKFDRLRIFQDDPGWQKEEQNKIRHNYRQELMTKGFSTEESWELAVKKYPLVNNS